jgi:hypothetical protein
MLRIGIFAIADRTFELGVRQTLAFRVVDSQGRTVRDFDVDLAGERPHRLFLQLEHDGIVRTAEFTERGYGAPPDHGEVGHGH